MSDVAQLLEDPRRLIARHRRPDKVTQADSLVRVVRTLALRGIFQPRLGQVTADAGTSVDAASRLFEGKRGLAEHVARRHAVEIVGGLGLSAPAVRALSARDVKAIAMAVLGGRRLEDGE